ncbi:MAG: diguanylate cyclase [Vulcanimicrobiaceae bacterium]|jgi:two-component system chemotaxis family response regulator WspR
MCAKVVGSNDIVVLLVDDQLIIGEAIRRAVADQPDISLHYCSDPAAAVLIAQQIKPTVILQDLVMPGTDGLTLVHQYRTSPATKDVPIIVLSTKEEAEVKCEAFARGANDYLIKLPATIELLARIRYHSKAYISQIQRDEAHQALRESQALLLEKNLELALLTNVDGLTGLSNRRHFDELLGVRWRQAVREQTAFSILMIDVDSFKPYNDTYGHLAGDEVLKQVAEAIRTCCRRPTDLAARFGGEEFIVCFSATSPDRAQEFAEKIRAAVEAVTIPHTGSAAGTVTVSIGVAWEQPCRGESSLPLIDAADVAMYEAKHSGKNRTMLQERHRASLEVP